MSAFDAGEGTGDGDFGAGGGRSCSEDDAREAVAVRASEVAGGLRDWSCLSLGRDAVFWWRSKTTRAVRSKLAHMRVMNRA